ncbi:hypothetical protein Q1695_001935 [Nippostrongylus brasiliensis]|nr:hypothetical protein Q1695_001935 [Nippostrongylus brasiliensis]
MKAGVLLAVTAAALDEELRLRRTLLRSYHQGIRPRASIINISVNLRFFTLLYMEQQEENMVFSGDFEMMWTDNSLVWNPAQYEGLDNIHVYEKHLWTPDVTVYNSVSLQPVIDDDRRLTTVTSDGTVQISNPTTYTVRCKLNIAKFPSDRQQCKVKLSSWVYTEDELDLSPPLAEFNLTGVEGNSEWEVTSLSVGTVLTEDTDGKKFQELHYTVELSRHSTYYVYVLFLPTFITTALCLVGLFTPFNNVGDRVERTTLGLTTLLSLAVILNIIGSGIPKSSVLPQLATYVLAEILLCCLGVLVTVILLVAHQRIRTRKLFLPLLPTNRNWSKSEPNSLGIRTLNSGGTLTKTRKEVDEVEELLRSITDELKRMKTREEFHLHWIKIFDVVDVILLILFQIANIVLSICYLFI